MATTNSDSHPQRPKTGRSMIVRRAAAQAAVTASKKTGRPVDERVKKIADAHAPTAEAAPGIAQREPWRRHRADSGS